MSNKETRKLDMEKTPCENTRDSHLNRHQPTNIQAKIDHQKHQDFCDQEKKSTKKHHRIRLKYNCDS